VLDIFLPDHPPEVVESRSLGTLRRDVCSRDSITLQQSENSANRDQNLVFYVDVVGVDVVRMRVSVDFLENHSGVVV
jgi:hypothetical protein